jgi:hypothetical protein
MCLSRTPYTWHAFPCKHSMSYVHQVNASWKKCPPIHPGVSTTRGIDLNAIWYRESTLKTAKLIWYAQVQKNASSISTRSTGRTCLSFKIKKNKKKRVAKRKVLWRRRGLRLHVVCDYRCGAVTLRGVLTRRMQTYRLTSFRLVVQWIWICSKQIWRSISTWKLLGSTILNPRTDTTPSPSN